MKVYFIHTGPEQAGPYAADELKSKGVSKETPVWREGLAQWTKAGELPELDFLFIPVPPPFVQKEAETISPPPFKQKDADPPSPPPIQTNIPAPPRKKNYIPFIIPAIILLVAAGIYFYFNSRKNKTIDVNKEKIVGATGDSLLKKDITNEDSTKKINLDTLSNWMTTDTIARNKENEITDKTGFTMGGIPVNNKKEPDKNNPKKKEKKDIVQPEEKKPEKKINANNENHEPIAVKTKNLLITGSFRKNLLLEAVLEGRIQNPNDNVSFRDIMVTVEFLGSDGGTLGTKRFAQSGTVRGGESVSFKFKANAPKGTKTARYDVSGSGF